MNEKKMKELIKSIQPLARDMDEADKFSCFDMETNRARIELKHRRGNRMFPDTMLEKQKFDKNIDQFREYHYVVASDAHQTVYFFNVTKLNDTKYDFNWHMKRCPATSDFGRREYVEKEVGGLKWDDAYHSLSYAEAYKMIDLEAS